MNLPGLISLESYYKILTHPIQTALVLCFFVFVGFLTLLFWNRSKKTKHKSFASSNKATIESDATHLNDQYANDYPNSQSSFFQTPWGPLFYRTVGSPQNPSLLVLHGIGSSEYCWRNNVKELSQNYFLVLPDFIGFGRSSKKTSPSFSFKDHSETIFNLLDFLKIDKTHMISCSMGGAIGFWMASENPDRFNKIISVAPAAAPTVVPFWARRLNFFSPLAHQTLSKGHLGPQTLKIIMNRVYYNKDVINNESINTYLKPYLEKEAHQAFVRHLYLLGQKDVYNRLANVRSQVLLIQGNEDRIISKKLIRKIQARIASAKVVWIEQAGHHPMEECPTQFNTIALNFLQD